MKNKLLFLFTSICIIISLCVCECRKPTIEISQVMLDISSSLSELSSAENQQVIASNINDVIVGNQFFKFLPNKKDANILNIAILPQDEENLMQKELLLLGYLESKDNNAQKHYSSLRINQESIEKKDFEDALSTLLIKIYNGFYSNDVANGNYLVTIKEYASAANANKSEVINAITLAGEHKNKEAQDYLITILKNTHDIAVGNACMMALGELESVKAMEHIINFASRKPPIIRRQAILAAKKIASKLALEWLLVMAYGYSDKTVSEEAFLAFLEVQKKIEN